MSNNICLKMQLLGKFSLENGAVCLDEESIHSNKLTKLLVFFLLNREKVLTHELLIDTFWEKNSKDPVGALKNLMHRLRKVLQKLGEDEYIITLPGAYRWNPEIKVESDYEEFEKLVRIIPAADNPKDYCEEALGKFKGNVAGIISSEEWAVSKVTWYQSVYMDIVKRLGEVYEKEEQWVMLEKLCNDALNMDALDEDIHYWIIKSLCGQNKFDLAMLHYETVSQMIYGKLGVRTSEKLYQAFYEMQKLMRTESVHLDTILREIEETELPNSVFYCDYQVFRQIYRMEMRRNRRSGMQEFLILLTLRRKNSRTVNRVTDSFMDKGMKILEQKLRSSLRSGDVVARYSDAQFLILLPTTSADLCKMVMERIIDSFNKKDISQKLELVFEMQVVFS